QFDAKYYLQQPVVTKVTALGEAAMIALKLKQNGVDIDKLAATLTAAATPAAATPVSPATTKGGK
ncbi:MAG: hypothetical protein PHQ27_09190, partial [Victivallales bacterium]|nr:hypothetical protein [Victivallales bacterium]